MVDTPASPSIPSTPTPGGNPAPTPAAEHPAPPAAPAAPVPPAPAPAPVPPAPAAAPAPVAPPAPVIDQTTAPWKEGEVWQINGKDWWDSIPEEPVRELMKTKQYANPAVAAVAYSNLNKLQNGNDNVIAVPAADATPEQKAQFEKTLRAKLGVPETVDGYKDLQLGEKPDDAMVQFGKDAFLKAGLAPEKAQQFVNDWNTFATKVASDALAAENAANDAAITALETKWGPELNANKAAGLAAIQGLGLPAELVEKVEGSIGTAAIVEMLAVIGKKTGEAGWQGAVVGSVPETPETMTKEAAQSKITLLGTDTAFQAKYMDKNHPEHQSSVDYMMKLHQRANAAA